MSGTGLSVEKGVRSARSRALSVLRIRSTALAVALLPAAVAVVLLVGGATGHIGGGSWDAARWAVTVGAVVVLLAAAAVAAVIVRARPAVSPTVEIAESSAPDLYRLVRDLADRLDVPAPSAVALTPDCDSWLEDRTHPASASPSLPARGRRRTMAAPVLVIGSPFLWWMRVAELRAVLAPVVAGTGPSAHPDIAAARRFVRGLDAAVAVSARPGQGAIRKIPLAFVGWVSRLLLRACRVHAAEMERGVAAAASERALTVDYGLRIVAQEQVGLAYAGWDRLLTRVALPAWRMGRWPSRLDAGVVSALTELSRRDRLAEGFTSRLGERPACDLLEEPGAVDEATSLLAARLFHGGPAEPGPDWSPVDWQQYPEEVVDRKWRADAARLHRVLDEMGVRRPPDPADPAGPTLARVIAHLTLDRGAADGHDSADDADAEAVECSAAEGPEGSDAKTGRYYGAEAGRFVDAEVGVGIDVEALEGIDTKAGEGGGSEVGEALAACISAEVAREETAAPPVAPSGFTDEDLWDMGPLPLFPLQPPRTGRELLADHVTAMVCCAAVDTAGAAPGLDWLDGPTLLVDGERRADLAGRVLSLVEDGDAEPLREWLASVGVRPEKPVRLV
ncbi:hypothetical protein [Streptomyces sp. H27-C3]|uniref:hypothetical protein n=1 Tax=Streptomyces sp. H27-C3 TaxID=3046305 RepID=UPI0024BAF3B1|nr:hypothetical protein [Streptomyces sp. H27-C3]MDJ0463498.1 hypothetical protein [Streptomyces sp. H27-C3]